MDYFDYGISGIYTIVEKKEGRGFVFFTDKREWDGFVLFTEGSAVLYEGKSPKCEVKSGDIIFLSRGDSYGFTASEPCSYITSGFFFEGSNPAKHIPRVMSCSASVRESISAIADEWEKHRRDSPMECKICLLYLYLNFLRDTVAVQERRDRAVRLAIDFIHTNFKRSFSSAEIAAYCSVSISCLRAKFQNETGMTITAYRDSLRLQTAKELLLAANFSIKETADALGFSDVYHFSKFFKSHSGTTPGAFVRACGGLSGGCAPPDTPLVAF